MDKETIERIQQYLRDLPGASGEVDYGELMDFLEDLKQE